MSILGAEFIRVSSGSQDESSQLRDNDEYAEANDISVVKRFVLHGYSASKGMQEPALQELIKGIEQGDYKIVLVTDSSRLDRREDLDAQAEILLAIRRAGGEVISLTEAQFGKTDFVGRIVTLVAQQGNAEKSRKVKDSTYRGMRSVADNHAHHGALPSFWATTGNRYAKQAYCTEPEKVADIYARVAKGESLSSVGRIYDLYPNSIKNLIRFAPNHTGVEECTYTHDIHGIMEWMHTVTPVVNSPLWWRANKVLDANLTESRTNKGGRPVAWPANWLSGILDCPECGGKLYMSAGLTPAGNPRTPKLRCGGTGKKRLSCGKFKGTDAQPVIDVITAMFANDPTPIEKFQRVAGNAHELEALKANLPKLQSQLGTITDRAGRREALAAIEAIEDRIASFKVIPDSFDYAPLPDGRTVARTWNEGDDSVKRTVARAVKNAWGMLLVTDGGQWTIAVGHKAPKTPGTEIIIDLGGELCFRRRTSA